MAKLTGKAKAEFLARMKRGRNKAARAKGNNPKKKKVTRRRGTGAAASRNAVNPRSRGRAAQSQSRKKQNSARRRRRNQAEDSMESAARKFEEFHGKAPGKVLDYELAVNYPEHFAELGRLKELRFDLDSLNHDFPLTAFKDCQVVTTPNGANIYFIGGDQRIDFEALNIASDKDMVELGPCTYIAYHTVKGFHDFEPITYWHLFGEEDGIKPVLAYDRLNHALFLIGGNYTVKPEGIVN
jgi:hypothetical protein